MGFTFGFSGEDVSDGEGDTPVNEVRQAQTANVVSEAAVEPKLHTLSDILASLVNVRVSFDTYNTIGGNEVFRRELFDVKHQAMLEDDNENEVHKILLGGSSDEVDLRTDVYEGGFKLWECSYDLVDELLRSLGTSDFSLFSSCLDMGCGTSLPTCFLLMLLFKHGDKSGKKFILADFNYDVLRLVTVPNLIIHWASTLQPESLAGLLDPDVPVNSNELVLTTLLLDAFTSQLREQNIELQFVSGSWGKAFCLLVAPAKPDLILTSETIYSLLTLPILVDVILELLAPRLQYTVLVAAKQYYFGVGGSVTEFLDILNSSKPDSMQVQSISANAGQLKRDIVRLQRR